MDDLTQSCANCGKSLSASAQSQTQNLKTEDLSGGASLSTQIGKLDPFVPEQQGEPAQPQRIGKYRIISHVATGGFGTVYKGYDGILDQYVAIKIPRKDKLDAKAENEFIREARTMAKLEHANIVAIKEAGRDESGFVFLVMKWIEGSTLAQYCKQHKLSETQCCEIAAKVARAMSFAHEQGFVHRDLKPSNILVNQEGEPFVTDFGLAVEYKSKSTVIEDLTAGTLPYMAPEQFNSAEQTIDHQTDIWALGVLFYQLLTGHRPFTGKANQLPEAICSDDPKPLRSFDVSIPARIESACLKCLQKEKPNRWHSAAEFATAISPVSQTSRWSTKTVVAVGAIACGMLIAVIVWFEISRGNKLDQGNPKPGDLDPNSNSVVIANPELGRVKMLYGPETNQLEVFPNYVRIVADGPTFVSLGSIDDVKSLFIRIGSSDWNSTEFILGMSGITCLHFRIDTSSRDYHRISRRTRRIDTVYKREFQSDLLGDKFFEPVEQGSAYDLKFYFQKNRIRGYTFGTPKDINAGRKSNTLNFEFNYGSDGITGIAEAGRLMLVSGEFGVYLDKKQTVTLSNLKVGGEQIEFKQ